MNKDNGQITLSAVDFLQLAEVKRVARVDLADIDYHGVVYVCELSTAQQQRLFGGQKGMRIYPDNSRDIAIPPDAAAKMISECLVTDGQDGALWEPEFSKTDDEYITVPNDDIVYMRDLWRKEVGNTRQVDEKIQGLPNVVTNFIMRHVNDLSGLGDDNPVEEKKSS